MTIYICNCGKNFKHKLPAKRHLENSHKGEILKTEVRQMDNSLKCLYCDKSIDSSTESHLRSHIKKIITLYFDTYMSKSS
jgi:hypothetical protein